MNKKNLKKLLKKYPSSTELIFFYKNQKLLASSYQFQYTDDGK